jgi:hypothetical protein
MTLTGQQRQAREQQPYGIPLGGDVHRVPPGIDVGSGFGKLAQSQGYRQLLGRFSADSISGSSFSSRIA